MAKKIAMNDELFERTMISAVNRNSDSVRSNSANNMRECKKNAKLIFFTALCLVAVIAFSVMFYKYEASEMTFSLCAVACIGGAIGYFVRDAVKLILE